MLAILPFAEVEFARNQVESLVAKFAHGRAGGYGKDDVSGSAIGQHGAKRGTHRGFGVDDQRGEAVKIGYEA